MSDEEYNEESGEYPIYTNIDDDTITLLEVCLNCMVQLADVQMNEDSRLGLIAIAENLAARFDIQSGSIEVEEHTHVNPDTGETETIYRPRGGVLGDDEDEEPTAPKD